MIPKLDNAPKHLVTPSAWKPATDTSVSPAASDFTPADTPTNSSSSNHQSIEDIHTTSMEDTVEGTTSKHEGQAPQSEEKAKEEVSPPKPEGPSTSKEPTTTNPKAKKPTCKKHAKDTKKKTKKHSKVVEADSSTDSDDSSSDSTSSSSSDDSSDSSSWEEDEASRKKRKSKAKKAKKLKAKKRAKAKAKAEDADSDSDDESSSSEEEKKKSKRKKQLKKKKRAKKSKEAEEKDDEEEEEEDEDEDDAAFNRQQLAQLQAMNLKRLGRNRAGRGSSGETVNISGELGKKNAKAKGKPGKRSVFWSLPSITFQKLQLQLLSLAKPVTSSVFVSSKWRLCDRNRGRHPCGRFSLPPFASCTLHISRIICAD